jgi:hypothetical protein
MKIACLKYSAILLLLWLAPAALAQNYWKLTPNIGLGNTVREKYIITTPGYMGPNALPIPEVNKGLVNPNTNFKVSAETHNGKGDNTQNMYAQIYYSVVPGKIAIKLYGVPIEHFSLTDNAKQNRRILNSKNTGYTIGDLYFSSELQLIKSSRFFPDAVLTLTCKTASGNNLRLARFTDAPAYSFDVAFGKDLNIPVKGFKAARIYGSGGFFAWQTNSDIHRQDDAMSYGVGLETNYLQWKLNQVFAGYIGYINLRDKPSVYRLQLARQEKHFNYGLEFQYGLTDFNYTTYKVSVTCYPFRKDLE